MDLQTYGTTFGKGIRRDEHALEMKIAGSINPPIFEESVDPIAVD